LITENIMPAKAAEDALHIAIAATHQMDFLLSWNFKHIANPVIQAAHSIDGGHSFHAHRGQCSTDGGHPVQVP